ncbi:MAG: ABC transporter substrate-binding protein [Limnochordales bacterium]
MSKSTRREFLTKAGIGAGVLFLPGISLTVRASSAPIKIGGSLPLTGAYADTGLWVERGYRYWAEQVNASDGLLGRPVELIIYDDASQVDRGISLLERAITVDRVDLLLGGYPGTTAAAQMAVAERYRKVYVSMGGHMASFQRGFRYSFGAPPLMGEWWYEGAFQWLESMDPAERPKRAAAITANNAVGMAVRGGLADGLARSNIELVMDELYDLPLASAEPLVQRAKALDADMFMVWGPGPRVLNTAYTGAAVHLLGISIPLTHAYGALLGLATIGLLYGFLYHTFPGKAVRAVWQQRDGAALCGIPLHRVTALTYGVSIASASVAGVAMALIYSFTPATYMVWLVNVFLIVIVGGVGSLLGAAAAGLIVGLVSSLSVLVMPFVWTNLALFGLLILVLLVRPSGLLKR